MDKSERATLGPLIRAAREGRGWSQEQLARAADTSRRTIGSIERGDTTGQVKIVRRVLDALGVVDGLVTEPDVKTFVQTITPLLQRLTEEERAQVMPAVVRLVADALAKHQATPANVFPFPARPGAPSDLPPTVTDEDLIGLPSVAEPERADVEGERDPEDT